MLGAIPGQQFLERSSIHQCRPSSWRMTCGQMGCTVPAEVNDDDPTLFFRAAPFLQLACPPNHHHPQQQNQQKRRNHTTATAPTTTTITTTTTSETTTAPAIAIRTLGTTIRIRKGTEREQYIPLPTSTLYPKVASGARHGHWFGYCRGGSSVKKPFTIPR